MSTLTSDTALVAQILEVLNDPGSFLNSREKEIEEKLLSAYVAFAKDRGLDCNDIQVIGMRAGLGALCGSPPDDYLIGSRENRKFGIWVGSTYNWRKNRVVQRVEIDSTKEHEKIAHYLKKRLEERGVWVTLSEIRPPSTEKKEETDWTDSIDDTSWPFHHGSGY